MPPLPSVSISMTRPVPPAQVMLVPSVNSISGTVVSLASAPPASVIVTAKPVSSSKLPSLSESTTGSNEVWTPDPDDSSRPITTS